MNMYSNTYFHAYENGYQLLGLPYVGGYLVMFILLPDERFGLQAIENQLTGQKLLKALEEVDEKNINQVSIPKFKLEETTNLTEILKQLGASDMFDGKADFSNINGKGDLYVSEVIHKAFIEVNEQGTEAVGAAAAESCFLSAPRRYNFIADHPFLFLIVDARTTSILFFGRFTG